MVRSQIKRSIYEHGAQTALESLSEKDRQAAGESEIKRLEREVQAENSEGEESEAQSTYPGAECQVIPITTNQKEYYFFGFLPDWANSENDYRTSFNARYETIRQKPMWKKYWYNNQRCLVVTSGFYELDRQTKKRYFFYVKNKPVIYFAGIFNHWKSPITGYIKKTFAIITTEPNDLVSSVHNRMPVILDEKAQKKWMNIETEEESVFDLLNPFPSERMEMKEAPKPPRKKKGGPELNLDF